LQTRPSQPLEPWRLPYYAAEYVLWDSCQTFHQWQP
jgi:hypothetical protein